MSAILANRKTEESVQGLFNRGERGITTVIPDSPEVKIQKVIREKRMYFFISLHL